MRVPVLTALALAADLGLDLGGDRTREELVRHRVRTGDLAERNDVGFYRLIGRRDRFSKLSGQRVYHDDVERRLQRRADADPVRDAQHPLAADRPRDAARRFNEAEQKFIGEGKVDKNARDAEKALDGPEAADLEAARKSTAAHAKK